MKIQKFKEWLAEDFAEVGNIGTGMGDVVVPTPGSEGSGDKFDSIAVSGPTGKLKVNEEINFEELQKKYPNAVITCDEKKPGRFFVRVDIKTQGGETEYVGALKGLVTKDQAVEFITNTLTNNYDKYY